MRKWYYILLLSPLLMACVGQKEDPEEETGPSTGPEGSSWSADEGTRPFHRDLALAITASWCQYCPNMEEAMSQDMEARPGRMVEISVHQYDELSDRKRFPEAAAAADELVTLFKASGFPQLVFDWDGGTMFNEQSVKRFTDYIDATVGNPTCNIALESSWADGKLQATVSVKADTPAAYSVAAVLVQDRLTVNQLGYGPGYACGSVLRRLLGAGKAGEPLGTLGKEEEMSCVFEEEIALGEAPAADFRLVAFVRKDGRVVNAVSCPLNGKISYQYEKENP